MESLGLKRATVARGARGLRCLGSGSWNRPHLTRHRSRSTSTGPNTSSLDVPLLRRLSTLSSLGSRQDKKITSLEQKNVRNYTKTSTLTRKRTVNKKHDPSHDQRCLTIPVPDSAKTYNSNSWRRWSLMLNWEVSSVVAQQRNSGGRIVKATSTQLGVSSIISLFYKGYNIIVNSVYCIKITTVPYCLFYRDYNSTISTVCLFYHYYNCTVKYCLFISSRLEYSLTMSTFVCFLRNSLQWTTASSFTRLLGHTQRRTYGEDYCDEWSARRRDLYLTTLTTDIHAPGGIRTHNLTRRAAADLRLRRRGQWDQKPCVCRCMNTQKYTCLAMNIGSLPRCISNTSLG